jgi:hypothetical protein
MPALHKLSSNVWVAITHHRMADLLITNNNLCLFLLPPSSSDPAGCLVACNVPKPDAELFSAMHAVSQEHSAPLRYILASDLHHLFVESWAAEFPSATVVFPSPRAPRLHSGSAKSSSSTLPRQLVVDRAAPSIPAAVRLIPFRGFKPASMLDYTKEEAHERAEFSVFEPVSGTLFFYDVLIPKMPQFGPLSKLFRAKHQPAAIWVNFRGLLSGFKLADPELARQSARELLSLPVERICFAHGVLEDIVQGREQCAAFLNTHLGELAEKGR